MDSDLFSLPALLAEIEAVAGRDAAIAIAVSFGGTDKKFPSPAGLLAEPGRYADNWLVLTVGPEKAHAICKEIFPRGGRAEIPLAKRALRNAYIMKNSAHLSVPEMATVLGVNERTVRKTRSLLRAAGMIS